MEIGGKGTHAPWNMPTEPRYDEEMIDIYRHYSKVRVALQDYIVRAAREAGETGMPIVRPLRFLYPDDPQVADAWDEYLFGPDILVAPVWRTGERAREVYLPEGEWRSWWDASERHTGPVRLTVAVPLDAIPVYVRDGADVPAPPS
jgi:alpha-glucosidase (family GH31 glycosyl hydrolase)